MSKPEDLHLREEAVRLWERSVRLDDELFNAPATMSDEAFNALEKAMADAREAYEANPIALSLDYDETSVKRCGASNVPITEDDEILVDNVTGEMFLRLALGLPPRKTVEAEQEQAA